MFDYSFIVLCITIQLSILIILTCYDLFKKKMFLKNMKNFSIAPYLPLIGSIYLIKADLDVTRTFRKVKRIVKNDNFIWFHSYLPVYVTCNANDFEIILSNVLERGFMYALMGDNIISDSLLTAKVSLWKINRKIISKSFKPRRLYNVMLAMNQAVNEFVDKSAGKETGLSIVEKNSRFSFEAFLLNFAWGVPGEVKDDSYDFYDIMRTVTQNPYKRFVKPWLYPKMFYKLSKIKREADKLNVEANKYVKSNIDILRKNQYNGDMYGKRGNVIEALDRANIAEEVILSEIKFLAGAASDTTGFTLTMALIALGIYPDIQKKVFEEVLECVGSEAPITHTELNQLKYTEMLINETLRLFPPVPWIMRKTSEPTDLENKIIPKDMEVLLWIEEIHRSELHWKNPLEFNPDRFLPEETAKRHPYAFVPFSGGPRNCIGFKYAMIFLVITVAQYVRKYKIGCPYKSIHDVKVKSYITSQLIDEDVICTFSPRYVDGLD